MDGRPGGRPDAGRGPRPDASAVGRAEPAQAPQHHARPEPRPERAPEDPARRERANLLWAYDSSTLTRANFCALKRISEADLEAQLTVARQEAAERAKLNPPPPRQERAEFRPRDDRPRRNDGPGGPRREGRGPRPGPGAR